MSKEEMYVLRVMKCFTDQIKTGKVCPYLETCSNVKLCTGYQMLATWLGDNCPGGIFVGHIKEHLDSEPERYGNSQVVCPMCYMDVDTIFGDAVLNVITDNDEKKKETDKNAENSRKK